MDSNKCILYFLMVGVVIFAIGITSCTCKTTESFMGLSTPGRVSMENVATNSKGVPFMAVPNWQSNIAPRFMPSSYGSHIQYNLPDQKNLAVPQNPLGYADMVRNEIGPETSKKILPKYQDVKEMFPTTDMKNTNNIQNTYNYNRLMKVGLQKSRAKSQADWIRGDLPIPKVNTGWFSSRYGTESLRSGAMNVLGGQHNETANALYSYMKSDSGNTRTTFAGAPLNSVNMAGAKMTGTSNGINQGDVKITMFP